jgi:alkanesulfonate monooxygenase SsuD/methylene tetrahydromethanopterin reductase-like flavin-dependent oxidoreductase (luciferase family)
MADPRLGFGVVAGHDDALLVPLAREVERLGYGALWINDSGRADADGLRGLAIVAGVAPTLRLGVGVLPLDRRSPAAIAASVAELRLPLERLWLGVGSGGVAARPVGVVRESVAALRGLLPSASVFISALGPQMSRLAGEVADGVLFNWAVPSRLAAVSAIVAEGAAAAGRAVPARWTYVRTAVGPDARTRIGEEAERYARSPAYGRAFEAMGVPFVDIGIAGGAGEDVAAQVAAYQAVVDGMVIRALPTSWTLSEVLAIARATAPPSAVSIHD